MTLVTRQNFIVCVSVLAQPSIRAIVTPAPNARGWNNTPVTITFACEGTSSCPAPVSLAADGAAQRVTRVVPDGQRGLLAPVVHTDEGISLIDASGSRAVVNPPTMHGFQKWH